MTTGSWTSLIMHLIGQEHLELLALKLKKKLAVFHFVYTLASTNINQSAPNLVRPERP